MENNNKILYLVVGLVLVSGIFAFYFFFQTQNEEPINATSQLQSEGFEISKSEVESSDLPESFPDDFPIEAGSTVIQSYDARSSDGRVQGTRQITTSQGIAAASKFYSDYFTSNGWTVVVSDSNQTSSEISLKLNRDIAQISVTSQEDQDSNLVEVTIVRGQ